MNTPSAKSGKDPLYLPSGKDPLYVDPDKPSESREHEASAYI